MKPIYFSLLLGGILMSQTPIVNASNQPCTQTPGQTICGPGDQTNINASGMVTLQGTTVTNTTTIQGMLTASNASLNTMDISGTVHLNQTKITGTSHIKGNLIAIDSKFLAPINLQSNHGDFTQCQLKNITMKSNANSETPTLILRNSSTITGNVRFTGEAGIVKLFGQSSVSGKVKNGRIIYPEAPKKNK